MQTVLIVIHLFVAIALTIVVLLQRSEGGALGMGGSGGGLGGFFSPRGAASTLTRTTAILGLLFFLTSLALTWLALNSHQSRSILDQPAAPGTSAPGAPGAAPAIAPVSRTGTAPVSPVTVTPAPAGPATTAPQPPAVPPSH